MGTESAIGCLVFSLAFTFFVSQSLPCSKLDSLPAHSLQIWLERWEILVSTKEWDGCGKPSGPLRPFKSFAPAPNIRSRSRSRLTLWCSQVFLIFPTIFPKSEAASCPALSTANFWETKKVSAREKTKHPTADSVSIRFSSTNWNWIWPTNGREISSSLFGLTRCGQL